MVYRLRTMRRRTKVAFFISIWIFSAICAIFGSLFIATAIIIPNTRADITYNPIFFEIRENMGPFIKWDYFNPETGDGLYYSDITLEFDRIEQRIIAKMQDDVIIKNFRKQWLIEVRENGTVKFFSGTSSLEYFLFNGTLYSVRIKSEFIAVDIENHQINFDFDSSTTFKIFRIDFMENTTSGNVDFVSKDIGTAFVIRNLGIFQWIQAVIRQIWEELFLNFLFIVEDIIFAVIIGGGLGILTAFFLIITRIARVIGGKYWTYFILKRLTGKLGRLLSFIPLFDFDGEFYVEERFVDEINLASLRSSFGELYKERWYDILIFPSALAAIFTILFVQFSPLDKLTALALSPLMSPFALILVVAYYPLVWGYNEGGFKRMEIGPQGDIIAIKPLGKILRDGLGIIIGFSGFVSLGTLGVEVGSSTDLIAETSTAQINVAGFTFDILGIAQLVLWTVGLFFVLLGSIIVGASLLALNNLETTLLPAIKYMREKSAKSNLITNWGTLESQFSPIAKPSIYTKESSKEQKNY